MKLLGYYESCKTSYPEDHYPQYLNHLSDLILITLMLYDQSFNNTFHQKMESIQYIAALALTGAIRGSSKEKLYQELGFEALQQRRWYRKLCYFFKLIKNKSPKYLFNSIPTVSSTYRTRNIDNIPQVNVRNTFFTNSYFPSIVTDWNNLDKSIRNSESFSIFKKNIFIIQTTISKEHL